MNQNTFRELIRLREQVIAQTEHDYVQMVENIENILIFDSSDSFARNERLFESPDAALFYLKQGLSWISMRVIL